MIANAYIGMDCTFFPLNDSKDMCIIIRNKDKEAVGHSGNQYINNTTAFECIRDGENEYNKKLLKTLLEMGYTINKECGFWFSDTIKTQKIVIGCDKTLQPYYTLMNL